MAELFEQRDIHRVFAQADDRNFPVRRLLERLGFRCEARLVDADLFKGEWSTLRIYAMLDREWRQASDQGRTRVPRLPARKMSDVTLASGLTLSYADQGDGSGPTVLLLPGPTDSWRSYRPVLDLLPRGIRAIAVSQRGHGESSKPETGYRVEHFAADVLPLLDALGVERAVLAGHSASCLVARRVALDHPHRVAGLILEASPTTLRDDARLRHFLESVVSELEDPISPELARSFVVDTSSENVAADLIDLLVDDVRAVPVHVWQETFAGLLEYDDQTELRLIDAPTLLVWGDADTVVSREMQDRLVGSIPAADLLVYPGVGHTPRWDDPVRFSSDLVAFVGSLPR
jgi:non-heme chloroperoxidase